MGDQIGSRGEAIQPLRGSWRERLLHRLAGFPGEPWGGLAMGQLLKRDGNRKGGEAEAVSRNLD